MKQNKEVRSFNLPKKMLVEFETKAMNLGVSRSFLLSIALEQFLQKEFMDDPEEEINIKPKR